VSDQPSSEALHLVRLGPFLCASRLPDGEVTGCGVGRLRFDADELTQREQAKLAGVTRQTIHTIEKGQYAPSLLAAFRLARAFGRPLEDVFRDTPDEA